MATAPYAPYGVDNQGSPDPVAAFFERMFLELIRYELQYAQFAYTQTLPTKSSNTMILTRPTTPEYGQLEPLQPGVTPPPTLFSQDRYTIRVEEYGKYTFITDYQEYTWRDPILVERSKQLIEQAKMDIDCLFKTLLTSTASVMNCTRGGNSLPITELNPDDLQSVITSLRAARGKTITPEVDASEDFSTTPVLDSFIMISSVELSGDLYNLGSEYVTQDHYQQASHRFKGELGKFRELRILGTDVPTSTSLSLNGTNAEVYNNVVLARNAYARVGFGNNNVQFIQAGFGSAGAADPLRQRATIGYKMFMGQTILNDAWVINLRSTRRY